VIKLWLAGGAAPLLQLAACVRRGAAVALDPRGRGW
jgi:hypothetical protein